MKRLGAIVAALLLGASTWAAPAHAGDVSGDDAGDGYVASGSMVLGPTFDGSDGDRRGAARCPGCRWSLRTVCRPGDLDGGETCAAAWAGCPVGAYRMRLGRWTPAEPWWRWIGTVCVGPGVGPVPVGTIAGLLRERVEEYLPRLDPSVQPFGVTLTNLPTVFATGQPSGIGPVTLTVLGHDIVLTADQEWVWDFGDGDRLVTRDPGGAWPDTSLVHRYVVPGSVLVGVTATWEATFTVSGLGPFDVAGPPVTQGAAVPLTVREARARLVR